MDHKIFQLYYQENQRPELDSGFFAVFNGDNPAGKNWAEWSVIRSDTADKSGLTHWGYVSWKFRQKTQTDALLWNSFIRANPDAAVYIMEPVSVPYNIYLNPFRQADYGHPGMLQHSQLLLDQMNYGIDLNTEILPMCYYSIFVLAANLWPDFLTELKLAEQTALQDPAIAQYMFHSPSGYYDNQMCNFVFFMERFINVYIKYRNLDARVLPYHSPGFVYNWV